MKPKYPGDCGCHLSLVTSLDSESVQLQYRSPAHAHSRPIVSQSQLSIMTCHPISNKTHQKHEHVNNYYHFDFLTLTHVPSSNMEEARFIPHTAANQQSSRSSYRFPWNHRIYVFQLCGAATSFSARRAAFWEQEVNQSLQWTGTR
ncbi:unnamed protein product [Pleuronectes platessa]|uniref:Uncharacterized protein n=1 Tax=Pleuronectes platessa TaxID=8262 RepID=A0A9N7V548_PLEPL|nr:unnamed protein product [Pleuronectes platessa]